LSGIEECTSPEFLLNLTTCFLGKFIPNRNSSRYEDDTWTYTGRRLMEFGDDSIKDQVVRETVVKEMSKDFFANNKGFLGHLDMAVKAIVHREQESIIFDRLKNVDFRTLLDVFLEECYLQLHL